MPSVWQNNKILKKWEKKNFKYIVNGDFNYNLADPLSDPLINAISKYLNVDKEYIYVGTGISQFINAILGMKCWNTIFLSNIEFALYKRTADINEKKVRLIESKYTNDFLINIKKYKSKENDLLCISSPRWFSGELFTKKQIKELLKTFKGTILVDEAYIDYSNEEDGIIDLCLKNERIILLRSFSKKFLASGLRTGYMITKKQLNGFRNTIIPPHSVTSYSANFFVRLLGDNKILSAFDETRNYIKSNRDYIYEELKTEKKLEVIKSHANFITIVFKTKNEMLEVYDILNDLAGIQKFEEPIPFIKIWVNNEVFSKVVIDRIKEKIK